MLREDRELLAELARVNGQVPGFVLEFIGGGLSPDAQRAFAHRLVDVAEQLLRHADRRCQVVIQADPQALVIEADARAAYGRE